VQFLGKSLEGVASGSDEVPVCIRRSAHLDHRVWKGEAGDFDDLGIYLGGAPGFFEKIAHIADDAEVGGKEVGIEVDISIHRLRLVNTKPMVGQLRYLVNPHHLPEDVVS